MRILLVGNYPLDHQASMLRYAEMLRHNLAERGHEVELIQPPVVAAGWLNQPTLRKWLGYFDKYVLFLPKLRSRARQFDLVHVCDHSNSMYLAHTGGRPSSITCHDLLAVGSALGWYPQQRIGFSGRMQQRWILKHLANSQSVVCVSSNTARDLARLTHAARQRVVVIPNALDHGCGPASDESRRRVREKLRLGLNEHYLLHVGGDAWYKNRPGVLRIFQMLRETGFSDLRLVMAGAPLERALREFVSSRLPVDSVIEVVKPKDEELWDLYRSATALLFPSLHEGFGWPVIEAQSCGCPVITSDRAPMTEVAGDAALYVDPEDEQGAAAKIAGNLDKLEDLREGGFRNVERFTTAKVMAQYEEFFAGVLRIRRSTDVDATTDEPDATLRDSRE